MSDGLWIAWGIVMAALIVSWSGLKALYAWVKVKKVLHHTGTAVQVHLTRDEYEVWKKEHGDE